jgi:Ca-activated chloride channel family protein
MIRRDMSVRYVSRCCAKNRRGTIIVLVAILIPVMLVLSAIAINMAYLDLCRTELYTACDAATRATGRTLTVTQNLNQARIRGQELAQLNTVAGVGLQLSESDFSFGRASRTDVNSRYIFDPDDIKKNAVQITARRDASSASGGVPLFFANVLGRSAVDISQVSISTAIEVDISLVLDRSGSMAYAIDEPALPTTLPYSAPPGWFFCDPAPPISRWRDLIVAVGVFLNELQNSALNEQICLSTYNHDAVINLLLTEDYLSILTALQPYTDSFCAGGTNIGGGINMGLSALATSPNARPHAAKVIVLMTDGIHNWGIDPLPAAIAAAAQGVQIFTITFSNEAEIPLMQQVAAQGGGRHYHANSPADLIAAFQEIARGLPNLLTQ